MVSRFFEAARGVRCRDSVAWTMGVSKWGCRWCQGYLGVKGFGGRQGQVARRVAVNGLGFQV